MLRTHTHLGNMNTIMSNLCLLPEACLQRGPLGKISFNQLDKKKTMKSQRIQKNSVKKNGAPFNLVKKDVKNIKIAEFWSRLFLVAHLGSILKTRTMNLKIFFSFFLDL